MPKVSVVIPVFNCEQFIGKTIQSLLDQSFQDFEVIVVDDGSTDGTEHVVRQFNGPISYLRKENDGVAAARNLGISHASGEWIAFLDADDVWYPNKLAIQLEDAQTRPRSVFFYSDMDAIDETDQMIQRGFLTTKAERPRKNRPNLVSIIFNQLPFPYPSTVLVRREVFGTVGVFNPLFRNNYHEDFDLFARIAKDFPIYFNPRSLVKYRITSSQDKANQKEQNWLILLHCLWEMLGDDPEKQAILLPYFAKHFSDRGKLRLRSGQFKDSRKFFSLAFAYHRLYRKNLLRWGLSYLPGLREFYIYWKQQRISHP